MVGLAVWYSGCLLCGFALYCSVIVVYRVVLCILMLVVVCIDGSGCGCLLVFVAFDYRRGCMLLLIVLVSLLVVRIIHIIGFDLFWALLCLLGCLCLFVLLSLSACCVVGC